MNEENDENLGFKREHVADLQLRLHALEGLISQNDILSNNKMENGGHLFELFQLAQVNLLVDSKFTFIFHLENMYECDHFR